MASTRTTVRTVRRPGNVAMATHRVEVRSTRRLSPQMVRVTLTGPTLPEFVDDGPDQRCTLFLPRTPLPPGTRERAGAPSFGRVPSSAMVVPEGPDWFQEWRALPLETRPVLRTFTVRNSRPELAEVDIDFVLHDGGGPATTWAAQARVGDRIALFGPRAEYAPFPGADWRLLVGDATAIPAVGAIVQALPVSARALVLLEVDSPADEVTMSSCAEVSVTWVHRNGRPAGRLGLIGDALRSMRLPTGRPAAWIAGEAAMVRSVRRHLVCERGLPAADVQFRGYWRVGSTIGPE